MLAPSAWVPQKVDSLAFRLSACEPFHWLLAEHDATILRPTGKRGFEKGLPLPQVVVSTDRNLRQQIWSGRHEFSADEPESLGGEDTAPTPYDLLLGSLGACTSITLQLYARRKGWPLEAVEIRLEHNRIHAEDCTDCTNEERQAAGDGYLEVVRKEIALSGPLTAEQVARLADVAERCPINRTLRQGIRTTQAVHLTPTPPVSPNNL